MRAFVDVFRDLRSGGANLDATSAMSQVLDGVKNTGKKGEFSLKFTVYPAAKGADIDKVSIECAVTQKVPELPKGDTLFFLDPAGSPVRHNPQQSERALRAADDTREAG